MTISTMDIAAGRPKVERPSLPGWLPWVGGRLVAGLAAVFVISAIVFVATQALPSDPARIILGPDAPQESVDTLKRQLGLDQPIAAQYIRWAGHALTGDFGRSIDSDVPAGEIVADRAANSLTLLLVVLLIAVPLSFWLGVTLALRRDRPIDRLAMTGLIVVKAIPSFIIAIALVYLFATTVFPVLPAVSLLDPALPALAQPEFLILPAITLVLVVVPFLFRLIRSSTIETLEADYIAAARLRGLPERRILWRHVVPNALVPAVQGIAMTTRVLLGGVLLVEVVFSYPGLGNALNAAIEMRDLPVIQAIALLTAVFVVLVNLAADIVTVLLTPKLRTARRPGIRPGTRAGIRQKAGI